VVPDREHHRATPAKENVPPDDLPELCRTSPTLSLFVVSVLALFLELMLIRWLGTEVRIFAYLQNTVLVVCFLGLGLGCFTFRQRIAIRSMLLPFLFLTLLLAIPVSRQGLGQISVLLSVLRDFEIWEKGVSRSFFATIGMVGLGLAMTYLLMVLILDIFVPIGRLMGRLINDHPRTIWAYSVNVAGSLLGIWCFVLLSVLFQPPITWVAAVAVLVLPFLRQPPGHPKLNYAVLLGIVGLSWFAGHEPNALEVVWSPYQKLVLRETDPHSPQIGQYQINVNNVGYQELIDLSTKTVLLNEEDFPREMRGLSQYDIPFLLHPRPQKALIVGAGGGNDAAGALRHDVEYVAAVDIDPAIISMGRRYHPEKPYRSPRVTLVNDDARSFFATCQERYDVIAFGLLDAHTMTTMTNARLDHYVYTRESIQRAKSLLADGGIMTLNFFATRVFIADRMARTLQDVFGQKPLWFVIPYTNYGRGGHIFVAGDLDRTQRQIATNDRLSSAMAKWKGPENFLPSSARITTDDWPYIYLKTARIPLLYYLLAGLMVALCFRSQKRLKLSTLAVRWGRIHWHFFFLGAAFLLLEVQNISKASVVLGNTWWVNAVIISGVLTMVLVANAIAARFPTLPLGPVYALLCATCLALYFVDLSRFAFLPYVTKALLVGGLTTLPIMFSGIVFIRSFAGVESKGEALGANLIGALAGGLLQSITFVTGIKALLLIVAGLYFLALLTRATAGMDKTGQFATAEG
jgi:spermidine synthase